MRKLFAIAALLLGFLTLGAVCFRLTEGWDWRQCFYEAVIIMTTVGLSATSQSELNPWTKLFIICYLMVGVGIFTYCVSQLGQTVVNLQVRGYWEKRAMNHVIRKLKDHYIVCGFGRMGRTVCRYLHSRNKPFVVIDVDEKITTLCREKHWPYIVGDSTHDEVLLTAGILEAKALTTVLPTDADNVYVVLSARLLNEKLQIVARASDEKAVDKLERAGANRVVSPFSSGATKIARLMLNPSVEDFFDVTDDHGSELELADVQITAKSPCVGKRLMDTDLRERGVMVIGIRRANGERLMPPPGTAVIEAGDCLFAFGSTQAVNDMVSQNFEAE
ncbi:MAG TPA: potassium channel protein [Schlesneria sp.]|jgi:voltage-gated potassium channel